MLTKLSAESQKKVRAHTHTQSCDGYKNDLSIPKYCNSQGRRNLESCGVLGINPIHPCSCMILLSISSCTLLSIRVSVMRLSLILYDITVSLICSLPEEARHLKVLWGSPIKEHPQETMLGTVELQPLFPKSSMEKRTQTTIMENQMETEAL